MRTQSVTWNSRSWRARWPLRWLHRYRARGLPGPLALAENSPRLAAIRAEIRRQAALPRVPSPGGWSPPAGVRPAWSWTPPPGLEPRLDRAPVWVRIWYGTPFVDRYAHAWLWYHGGWDVVPPESWGTGSASGQ